MESSLLRLQRQYGNRYVGRVLRRANSERGAVSDPDSIERSIDQARGGGRGLDHGVRKQMETSIGADFGRVRVHTDAHADTLSKTLSARAFAVRCTFARGRVSPGMPSWKGDPDAGWLCDRVPCNPADQPEPPENTSKRWGSSLSP